MMVLIVFLGSWSAVVVVMTVTGSDGGVTVVETVVIALLVSLLVLLLNINWEYP